MTLREAVDHAERNAVLQALTAARGNKAEAARLLGISYKTLFNKLHEHGIQEGQAWGLAYRFIPGWITSYPLCGPGH